MFHFVYKTTNNINNMIYIGVHSTLNIDDGYIGSGKALKRAIAKYGKDNFTREIVSFYESADEAYASESQIVDADFVKRRDNYNMKAGGSGGSTGGELNPWYGRKHRPETIAKMKTAQTGDKHHTRRLGVSEETRRRLSVANSGSGNPMYGKPHPAKGKSIHNSESRAKISAAHKGRVVSEETKAKWRETFARNKDRNAEKYRQKVSCDGRIFDSCKIAAEFYGKSPSWVSKQLKLSPETFFKI